MLSTQSHYREVLRWEILMEQELIFGLDLGWLALLKKNFGPIMSNFFGRFFQVFMGKKMNKNSEASILKSCIKLKD